MQMMINQEVDRLVHKHVSEFSNQMHLQMQDERDRCLYKIEQF